MTIAMNDGEKDVGVPNQLENPDWAQVQDLAFQAAAFTMQGDMTKANDVYQSLAIEVMHTLYGPNAVLNFIKFAMDQEARKAGIIELDPYRFRV
jgi:hypothetical protein